MRCLTSLLLTLVLTLHLGAPLVSAQTRTDFGPDPPFEGEHSVCVFMKETARERERVTEKKDERREETESEWGRKSKRARTLGEREREREQNSERERESTKCKERERG